jgi:hypothetical protein
MLRRILTLTGCLALFWHLAALAGTGTLTYRARVVHNNRATVSYVAGVVDLASGDFDEQVERSFSLDWQRLPGRVTESRPALPDIWSVGGRVAQRYAGSPPTYDSELLRHFILGRVLTGVEQLAPEQQYLNGQLVIGSVSHDEQGFEVVASFRGTALVVAGRYHDVDGLRAPSDFVVLGPASELYQYFFTDMRWQDGPPATPITLPQFNPADYVTFPKNGVQPVAIRPVKDWLVFQATLPNGRPLNLVFDSGAETMIVDDWVLQLDSDLQPVGEMPVSGGLASGTMQLYEGFSFVVGGVEFKNLAVAGTQLTMLGFGADLRIHGIVGGDILRLCQLDLDLDGGQLKLSPLGQAQPPAGEAVPLTIIQELPHVTAQVHGTGDALLLLDTGQRTSLQVNLDWLDSYQLGDELMLNGFLGDVAGGLTPRYIIEQLDLQLGQERYTEKTVDASLDSTFTYDGLPVVGSIGFPLLARHFGGITFDYSQKLVYLRDPGDHTFLGQPDAWPDMAIKPVKRTSPWHRTDLAGGQAAAGTAPAAGGGDQRRPVLSLRSADELRAALESGAYTGPSTADPLDLVAGADRVRVPQRQAGGESAPANAIKPDAPRALFASVAAAAQLARQAAAPTEQPAAAAEPASTDSITSGDGSASAPDPAEAGQPAEATEPKPAPDEGAAAAGTEPGEFSKGKSKLKFGSNYSA